MESVTSKKTLTQAKGLTKDSIRNNKELLAELDAQLELLTLREKLYDKIQEAKNQLRQSPDNQEAILMAGMGKFLLDPDPQEALSLLRKCQEPTIKKFSDDFRQGTGVLPLLVENCDQQNRTGPD